jgi:glyceraldehyde-3-phosphate dehydrogenase/erythrose-4-phosphate dehydrogenase
MSDAVIVALITGMATAVPLLAVQFVNLIVSLHNGRKVDDIKAATDGMKDALVKVTRSDALQEGHTAGVADQKADQKARGSP